MTLRWSDLRVGTKLTSLAGVAVLGLVVSVGLSAMSLGTLNERSDQLAGLNALTRVSLEADMAHDAVKGDVLQAMTFPAGPQHQAALDAVGAHGALLQEGVARLRASGLGRVVDEHGPATAQAVEEYLASARTTAQTAGTDLATARRTYPAFSTAFRSVEVALPVLSDAVEAAAGTAARQAQDEQTSALRRLLAAGLACVLLVLWTARQTALAVVGPLRRVSVALTAMAEGDLTVASGLDGRDELGDMGRALGAAQDSVRSTVQALTRTAADLRSGSASVAGTATSMAHSADRASAQADVVSSAAEQVSRNVQSVAAGAEEMGASIREIAQNANEAARVAGEAVEVAHRTNATVTELGLSSQQIGEVVKVITSIAEQTNLFALNATIEAARAGEAGKSSPTR